MRNYPEADLVHRPLMQVVRMHMEKYPALLGLIHVPNESKRTKAQHGMLIGLGMRAGVSDLLLLRARRGYAGLAIELKAPGKLKTCTPEQKSFLKQQLEENWLACVCDDPAIGWSLLRWYVGGELPGLPSHWASATNILWARNL